jgi:hypothetical protein
LLTIFRLSGTNEIVDELERVVNELVRVSSAETKTVSD